MRSLARGSSLLLAVALVLPTLSCVESAPDLPTEQDIKQIKENILTKAPTPKYAVNADLEGKVTYLGLDVNRPELRAGEQVTLTHYWKVVQPPGEGWRLFVHVQGKDGKGFVNVDHNPVNGKYKVSQWKAGEIIRDRHSFTVPANWPSDEAKVMVGLWKGKLRMKISKGQADSEGRLIAAELKVVQGRAKASARPSKRYVATKVAAGKITVDGKLDEAEWSQAKQTDLFVGSVDGKEAGQKTWAKMLWDDENLYVAFHSEDSDIWASLKNRDDKLWTKEAVELFLDPSGKGTDYFELQVSPANVIFDSFLPRYRQNQNDWDSGVKSAVAVDGTLNKRDDTDKSWTVELALPIKNLKNLKDKPIVGTRWRMNMFRMDKPKDKPQVGTAWSPPLVGDFHALHKFGELGFGDDKGEMPRPALRQLPKGLDTKKLTEALRKRAIMRSRSGPAGAGGAPASGDPAAEATSSPAAPASPAVVPAAAPAAGDKKPADKKK